MRTLHGPDHWLEFGPPAEGTDLDSRAPLPPAPWDIAGPSRWPVVVVLAIGLALVVSVRWLALGIVTLDEVLELSRTMESAGFPPASFASNAF